MGVICDIESAITPIEKTVRLFIPGYGPTSIGMVDLSRKLLDRSTPQETRDLIWRHIVSWARRKEPYSALVAIYLALPGIRHAASRAKEIYPHGNDTDAENETLAGFLEGLGTVDLDKPRVCSRLCGAAFSAGRSWARRQIATSRAIQAHRSHKPRPQFGHIDLVLARAITEKVITTQAAALISMTRIDKTTLAEAATATGIDPAQAARLRKSAEKAIKEWLAA